MNVWGYVGQNPLSLIDPDGLWAIGDPLPQGIVNAIAGFGDGAYKAITLGLGNLQDIRNLAGIKGNINKCSTAYNSFNTFGKIVGSASAIGAIGSKVGITAWARRYPNAGGGGIGLDQSGKNFIRADWHKFKLGDKVVNRPHIDIPGITKHWPWR